MAINLNGVTPAAPAGSVNVIWQEDVSGNVSAYAPTSAVTLTPVDLTAQTANISAATIYTPAASGRYRISGYIVLTTADGASSTLPKITITWTDADNSVAQSFDLTATAAGNTTTTLKQGSMIVSALLASNIQYATSGYLSGTPAAMRYALHITIEKL